LEHKTPESNKSVGVLLGTATSACGSLMWALLIAKWFPGPRRAAAAGILQAATPASPLVGSVLKVEMSILDNQSKCIAIDK
jgi:hypothetical protein